MIDGEYEGKNRHHPEIRAMFDRKTILESDWYNDRLRIKQERDVALWTKNIQYLESFLQKKNFKEAANNLDVQK